jgi:pimeloyl-ACP methyl ester carboxylesterase
MDITPFRIDIPQAELDDLRQRLTNTRWPAEYPGAEWSRGVPVAYLRRLVDYWLNTFDWRAQEAALNEFPQFVTEIDGQRVHFLHVRSERPDAVPMVLTHGWPGSIAEFTKVIGPLVDAGFHVVVPALPGFGFSGPVTELGWNHKRVAAAWASLMAGLGYERYVAQGGDLGAAVTRELGVIDVEHVLAIHVNGGLSFPMVDGEPPADLTDLERARLARMAEFMAGPGYYLQLHMARPQTVAYALTDSPVGQLAWIVERFKEWTDLSRELPEDAVDLDQLLTNVCIYWFTRTAGSSAGMYAEDAAVWGAPEQSTVPAAVAQFTVQDISIRRYDEVDNNVVRWTEFDRGGHFAAMEAPDLLVKDVVEFFSSQQRP